MADDTFGDTGRITGFALDIQTVSYVCLAVTSNSPTMLGDATTFNATVHSSFDALEWQFGDASSLMEGSERQVSHTYSNIGDYTAKISAILFAQKVATLEIPVSVVFGSPASLELSASPPSLSTQLDNESTLSVTVRDSNGNLVPNQPVTFQSTFGTLNPERATTNSNGVATSRLSNPDLYVGSSSISAQAGDVSASSAVNFVSVACNDVEDNDTLAQSSTFDSLNAACTGSLEDDAQEGDDYYHFELVESQPLHVTLRDMPNGANYNLQLFNGSQQAIAASTNKGNADEEIVLSSQPVGRYYVRINQKTKAAKANQYTLAVSTAIPTLSTGSQLFLPILLR